ncbi:MAG: RsmB/NOP family class I SAM-dependent RNA methyltransferase [Candidatus Zixiibacteriota bacterium]
MKAFEKALNAIDDVLFFKSIPDESNHISDGIFRSLRRIDYAIKRCKHHKFTLDDNLQNIMRIGVYLAAIDHDFPTELAVSTAVEKARKYGFKKQTGFVNAVLRKISNNWKELSTPSNENFPAYLATLHSFPDYLVHRWIERYGRKYTDRLMSASNKKPPRYFRINQLLLDTKEYYEELDEREIKYKVHPKFRNFFELLDDDIKTSEWEDLLTGRVTVQDPAFEAASICLAPEHGERILEIGCAPGGKLTRLFEMTGGHSEIIGIESDEARLARTEENLQRLMIAGVKTILADARDYRPNEKFDRVLVDPPCSSLGVLRRHPEIKWLRDEDDIKRLAEYQKRIAENAMELVKPGGILVWSTCTTEPEENEGLVKHIVSFGKYELVPFFDERIRDIRDKPFIRPMPVGRDYDGGFCAVLRRI